MRLLNVLASLAVLLSLSAPAGPTPADAQDRARTKEVIVAFAAEPRTLLPNTIVDWTTNDQVEHIYDRLVDREPRSYKPAPMLATGWKIVNDTTWEFTLRHGIKLAFWNTTPITTLDFARSAPSCFWARRATSRKRSARIGTNWNSSIASSWDIWKKVDSSC